MTNDNTPRASPEMRAQMAQFLPEALSTAITAYSTFSKDAAHTEPGAFKSHYDALRVAVAHMELLTKLAAWADLPDPCAEAAEQDAALAVLMARANAEIQAFKAQGGEG